MHTSVHDRHAFAEIKGNFEPGNRSRALKASRFAVDTRRATRLNGNKFVTRTTAQRLKGMVEYGIRNNYEQIVFINDARVDKILRLCGMRVERIGSDGLRQSVSTVAGRFPIDQQQLKRIAETCGLWEPSLCVPVVAEDAVHE